MQTMKKTMVEIIFVASSIYHCVLFLHLPSGDVRWYPSAALGSLSEATSDPYSAVNLINL